MIANLRYRLFFGQALVLTALAVTGIGFMLTQHSQPQPVSAVSGGPEMGISITSGAVCSGQPAVCDVPAEGMFTVSIDAVIIPEEGYHFVVAVLDFATFEHEASEDGAGAGTCDDGVDNGGDDVADRRDPDCVRVDLTYLPGDLDAESLWDGCNPRSSQPARFELAPGLLEILCAGSLPPILLSMHTGPLFLMTFSCSDAGSVTTVKLLPPEHMVQAIGSVYMHLDGFTTQPKLNSLTVNCIGDTPPPTPAPTATPTPTPTAPPPPVQGDVNCDDALDSRDAALVLQFTAGLLEELPCADLGDLNGDGNINSIDALAILQQIAGNSNP